MSQKGMTLVELMVVLVVASIIGIAVLNMFTVSSRTFMDQNKVIDVQREGRLVMDYLARVIREAGLNPLNSPGFSGVREPFSLGQIIVDRDIDLDGVLDPKEVISFKRSGSFLQRGFEVDGFGVLSDGHNIAKNIIDFGFKYYDASGDELDPAAGPSEIRSVDIILTFKDEKFLGGDFVRTYKRRVDLRNF